MFRAILQVTYMKNTFFGFISGHRLSLLFPPFSFIESISRRFLCEKGKNDEKKWYLCFFDLENNELWIKWKIEKKETKIVRVCEKEAKWSWSCRLRSRGAWSFLESTNRVGKI